MSRKITASSHLSAEQLRAFQAGTLPEEHIPEVEAHLQSCVACCDALSGLPEDDFLLRVRCACENPPALLQKKSSSTPPPQDTVILPETTLEAAGSATPLMPGYENVRELGRGGMGVVYAARHAVMGRGVAIKVIHPEFSSNPVAVERFRREVLAAARLSHPNIVTAYDAGEDGGRSFLVMEHIVGESLGDRLDRLGPLPVAEVCDAVRQAALGVQHAHDHGLIHRDLKPHNLMRTTDGTVKVCDFGLAALLNDRRPAACATEPNAIMGTPDYMAPEQAEDARSADGRADVYALGCTLYHLLTGHVPFPEESVLLKLVAHRTRTRPSASRFRPEIPAELDGVLRRAIARKPANRYQTPGDFAKALEPFADSTQCSPRRHGRKRLLVLAALLLSLCVGITGVVRLPMGKDQDVVIQTDDPEVEVVVKGDRIVRIVDPKTGKAYQLDRDDLTLGLADDPNGLTVTLDGGKPVVLKRRGQKIATVRLDRHPANNVGDSLQPDKGKRERRLQPGKKYWLDGYDDAVWGVAFSPDGRYTLTTGHRNNLHELPSLRLVRRIGAGIWFAAFSPDGKRTLTSDLTMRGIILSETETGREIRRFGDGGFLGPVRSAVFSPDGKVIAVIESDTVRVFDAATGEPGMTAPTNRACRPAFAFTADSRRLLVIHSDNRSIRTFEIVSGKEVGQALLSPDPLASMAVSPDGKTVLGTRWERYTDDVLVWDATSGKLVRRLSAGQKLYVFNDRRVAFLPDGRRALVTNAEGTMILWDVVTGSQVRRWDDLGGIVSLAVSPDGAWALCGLLHEKRAFLLPLLEEPKPEPPGEVLRLLQGGKFASRIAVSPDGRFIWTAGDDFDKHLLCTGELLQRISAQKFAEEVLPSPDGKMLLLAEGGGGGAQLYDAATLKPIRPLVGSPARLIQAVWLPDGRLLTGGNDRIARLWDARTGKVIREFRGHTASVDHVDVNRDGTRILTFSSGERTVRVWDPDDGKELWSLSGQAGLALFAPDGRSILIGGRDGVIRRIAYPSGTVLRFFRSPGKQSVNWDRLCLLPDGRHFLSAGSDRVLRLWDLETGRELYRAEHPGQATAIAVTPDGRYALLGTDFGSVLKWRLPSSRFGGEETAEHSPLSEAPRLVEVRRHELPLCEKNRIPPHAYAAAYSSDGTMYAGGGDDGLVRIWNRQTGQLLHTLRGRTGWIRRIAFTPDGKRLVSSDEQTLRVWDMATGRELQRLPVPKEGAGCLDIASDGTHLVSNCFDNTVRIWNLESAREVRCLKVGEACEALFLADGQRIVTWNRAGTLKLWDAATGNLLATERGSPLSVKDVRTARGGRMLLVAGRDALSWRDPATLREVRSLKRRRLFEDLNWAVSPDGRFLIVADPNEAGARLWDLEAGKEIDQIELSSRPSMHMAFSPDGRHIAAGSFRGFVYLLRIEEGATKAHQED